MIYTSEVIIEDLPPELLTYCSCGIAIAHFAWWLKIIIYRWYALDYKWWYALDYYYFTNDDLPWFASLQSG